MIFMCVLCVWGASDERPSSDEGSESRVLCVNGGDVTQTNFTAD